MRKLVISVALVALVACGGGGGGGGSWLTFSPASISAAFSQGHTDWVRLVGTASSEPDVPISVGVVLDQAAGRVFDQASQPSVIDTTSLALSLHVSASLPSGTYDGAIEVRVCQDADARVCNQPYRGSPWRVPYHVVIQSPGSETVGQEMVRNGGFDAAMTYWDTWLMNGGGATFGVAAGVLGAGISAPTRETSNVQLKYVGGLNLINGHVYRFSFDAWADASRTIDTTVWENGHDLDGNEFAWSTYAYTTHNLTTTSQRLTVTFTMPLTNADAGIGFFFGGSSAAVHVDNVSVVEVTGTGNGG